MARKKKSKKERQHDEPEALTKSPHSFVIKRGKIGKNVGELMGDFKKIMEPFTASNLKVRRKNVVKDFLSVASFLNVTHLVCFTKTVKAIYMRLCRVPKGPTLTYKVCEYSLARDVRSNLRKPLMYASLFQQSPLIIMNAFSGEELEIKLMASMWRNLFPSIDINKANLNSVRRCVLLNYDPDTKLIDLRHYAIKVKPVGLSRAVKKLVSSKRIPDLGRFNQIEDAVAREAVLTTESEGEAMDEVDESRQVTLPQKISSRGNMVDEKSAIRLVEIGPRMKLELIKVEEGLMSGDVLYHSYLTKTKAEIKQIKKEKLEKAKLKDKRKKIQAANVAKKREIQEAKPKNRAQRSAARLMENNASKVNGGQEKGDSGAHSSMDAD
ncbi:Suppressor of SWI4 1 -like protein [Halotydeus destructor]|nr:Suppressor of SWI4 1 -like protein [Halotydeus destructor]